MGSLLLRNLLLKNKPFIKILSITSMVVFAAVLVDFLRLGTALPNLQNTSSQIILDRYGNEIRHSLSLNGERRYLIPLDKVPDQLRNSLILAEDQKFYEHHGVDFAALARGAFQSLKQLRKVSGGSTITMQLVKTLWPEMRGALHKPAQILEALALEMRYSKGEILQFYLNTLPYGNKISGVGAACKYFFNTQCSELSASQIAVLSILPRNPTYYLKKRAVLLERRNALLQKMLPKESEQELAQAISEPITFTKTNPDFYANHFTEKLQEDVKSGAEIHTTLDLELQKSVQEMLYAEFQNRKGTGDSGAVLIIENETGAVLAYVGSPDYFDSEHGMVDGVQALRSPGSALKPFIYELALENNWNLFDLVPDIPMLFSTSKSVHEPHNYGGNFSGPRTLREALGNSKNIPALYLTSKLGEAEVLERLRAIGFTHFNQDSKYYGVGLALGNAEVNLWELTEAYATLARKGVFLKNTFYANEEKKPKAILSEEATYLIADVLQDAEARKEEFGRFGPLEFPYAVGVKTGTSTNYRDHWTIGFTRKYTVGVWRGNADSTSLPERISASRGAGPLFHKIMERVHLYSGDPTWLARPEQIESSQVCAFSGQKPGKFCPIKKFEQHVAGHAPQKECEFHKKLTVENCNGKRVEITYLELPKEYAEWSKTSQLPTLENELKEKCPRLDPKLVKIENGDDPVILQPLSNTTYAIDPTIPKSHQEIRFAVRNAAGGFKLYVNDQPTEILAEDNELYWKLTPGDFKFYLKKGNVVSNEVRLKVR